MYEKHTIIAKQGGWLPKGATHPNLDPNQTGFMIAHDIIEHQNGAEELGTLADELEAFGAVWLTRGLHNRLFDNLPAMPWRVLDYYVDNMAYLYKQYEKGHILPKLEGFENSKPLDGIIAQTWDTLSEDLWDQGYETEFTLLAQAHMQVGFDKAVKRFGHANAARDLFWAVCAEVQKVMEPNTFDFEVIINEGDVSVIRH